MKTTIRTEGFRELEQALAQIEKTATAKAIMRRSLIKSAEPMAALGQSLAPVGDSRQLAPSVGVSTRLSGRQRSLHRKMFRSDKATVEAFVGAGPLASAHNQEFGNINHGPQPFMRPAWDAEAMPTLARLGRIMWSEIEATARRAARRAARLARKG